MIAVCIIGLGLSLVPAIIYTDPFWGVAGFASKELLALNDLPGVIITKIDSGSPAASAGLRQGDRAVTLNGAQVDFGNFGRLMEHIQPGERATLEVNRDGRSLNLVSEAEALQLSAVLFLDWQFVTAPVFLALILILVATEPLKPPPLWRSILVTLGGLVVIAVPVIFEVTHWFPWTVIWRSRSIGHGPSATLHYSLIGAALLLGVSLSVLGALGVRAFLLNQACKLHSSE